MFVFWFSLYFICFPGSFRSSRCRDSFYSYSNTANVNIPRMKSSSYKAIMLLHPVNIQMCYLLINTCILSNVQSVFFFFFSTFQRNSSPQFCLALVCGFDQGLGQKSQIVIGCHVSFVSIMSWLVSLPFLFFIICVSWC
jgi:hypothetical protein